MPPLLAGVIPRHRLKRGPPQLRGSAGLFPSCAWSSRVCALNRQRKGSRERVALREASPANRLYGRKLSGDHQPSSVLRIETSRGARAFAVAGDHVRADTHLPPTSFHPPAPFDVLAVEEEPLVENADVVYRLPADNHRGTWNPAGTNLIPAHPVGTPKHPPADLCRQKKMDPRRLHQDSPGRGERSASVLQVAAVPQTPILHLPPPRPDDRPSRQQVSSAREPAVSRQGSEGTSTAPAPSAMPRSLHPRTLGSRGARREWLSALRA